MTHEMIRPFAATPGHAVMAEPAALELSDFEKIGDLDEPAACRRGHQGAPPQLRRSVEAQDSVLLGPYLGGGGGGAPPRRRVVHN